MRSRIGLVLKLLSLKDDFGQILTQLELREALQDCSSVLDVGCGPSSRIRWLGFTHTAGLEGHRPSFEAAQKDSTHDEIVFGDVRQLDELFKPGQFDACVAFDVIEHLPKEDGLKMMAAMERSATRKVVLLTPKGFLSKRRSENDDPTAYSANLWKRRRLDFAWGNLCAKAKETLNEMAAEFVIRLLAALRRNYPSIGALFRINLPPAAVKLRLRRKYQTP